MYYWLSGRYISDVGIAFLVFALLIGWDAWQVDGDKHRVVFDCEPQLACEHKQFMAALGNEHTDTKHWLAFWSK